jgi:hypothetical protein
MTNPAPTMSAGWQAVLVVALVAGGLLLLAILAEAT